MSARRRLLASSLFALVACGDDTPAAGAPSDAQVKVEREAGPRDAQSDRPQDAGGSKTSDAALDAHVARERDAAARTRPDGGYPTPCDPETGRWKVLPDPLFYNDHRVTAYVVDFPNRRVIGSSELTLPPHMGGDNWVGEIDLEQLDDAPTCDELANHFVILVGYDEEGKVSSASTEDLFLRGVLGVGSIRGAQVANCRLAGTIRADTTSTSKFELFPWSLKKSALDAPITLSGTPAYGSTADYMFDVNPLPYCGPDEPAVYIFVDHDGDDVLGLYPTAASY